MKHQEAQDVFLDYIDGRLGETQTKFLRAHLDECPSCTHALAEYQQTIAQLHDLRAGAHPLTRGFGDEIMEQLRHEEDQSETRYQEFVREAASYRRVRRLHRVTSVVATLGVLIVVTIAGTTMLGQNAQVAFSRVGYSIGGGGGAPVYSSADFDDLKVQPSMIDRIFGSSQPPASQPQPGYYSTRQPEPRFPAQPHTASQYGSIYSPPVNEENYSNLTPNDWTSVAQQPVSTFAADIDTGSYTNVRRFLRDRQLPPASAVRVEEMVNYFHYRYPAAEEGAFGVSFELAPSPFDGEQQLLRVGIKAKEAPAHADRSWNLVFLIDVSGSMAENEKLPLLKQSLALLVSKLRPEDKISIVTYADSSSIALPSTSGANKAQILSVISRLQPAGSTNGGDGINSAYRIARSNFIPGGVNRVILATDGDFNVGVSSFDALMQLIAEQQKSGINLTALGMGKGNLKEKQLEQLADRGNGNYFYLDSLQEADRIFSKKLASTIEVVAKDVKLQLEFNPGRVAEYRLLGFENRGVAEADFTNDTVDGGEIGSGHTVTVLYEVHLKGDTGSASAVPAEVANELGFLKLRYKEPNGDNSVEKSFPLTSADVKSAQQSSEDFRFAVAVAAFGDLLRGSGLASSMTLRDIERVARENSSFNPDEERSEFASLVNTAQSLAPYLAGPPARRYPQITR